MFIYKVAYRAFVDLKRKDTSNTARIINLFIEHLNYEAKCQAYFIFIHKVFERWRREDETNGPDK